MSLGRSEKIEKPVVSVMRTLFIYMIIALILLRQANQMLKVLTKWIDRISASIFLLVILS